MLERAVTICLVYDFFSNFNTAYHLSITHVLHPFSVVREVKRESSISFDISMPESPASVKRKRVKRELEENGEHPKKQVPSDSIECLYKEKQSSYLSPFSFCTLDLNCFS